MTYAVDLHTHSAASPDGGLTLADYERMLHTGPLDYIAITDHNTVDFAQQAQNALGDHIIVGEEIKTSDGEIIGLFLHETIPPGLSAADTIAHIRTQRGLAYIPHPFEARRRSGISLHTLNSLANDVDIIEIHNGRAVLVGGRGNQAVMWAAAHKIPGAASSDAHGRAGWGNTYSQITQPPTAANLPHELQTATHQTGNVGIRGLSAPTINRLRRKIHHA